MSRRGRVKLLEMLVQELGSRSKVSNALHVSKSTLSGWLNEKNRHPGNSFTERILSLARELNIRGTQRILSDELRIFREALVYFVRRGANRQK